MQSYYCVGQIYVTNETSQLSERKLIDIHSCEWSLTANAQANSMLRQYDTANTIYHSTILGYKTFTF